MAEYLWKRCLFMGYVQYVRENEMSREEGDMDEKIERWWERKRYEGFKE